MKLGCDPEIFLTDAAGTLRSSIGLIGGSKNMPLPLPLGDGFAVQEDNVAIEFNIPASSNADEFSNNIASTIAFLSEHVQSKYGLAFSRLSAASFPPEELTNPAALEFGCDPDFNAWTLRQNPRPKASDKTLRSCGGHVHVGHEFDDPRDAFKLIKLMDLFLGVPSVMVDHGQLRKQLYGKAGAFRTKIYGVEYRTLSNFWVFEERLRQWVWSNTEKAINAIKTIDVDADEKQIVSAINTNNAALAQQLVQRYNIAMP